MYKRQILDGGKFAVLTDILGDEDHLGDMDFKVAGTENGVTALQMDIKIQGITKEIMQVALAQAREGRLHILGLSLIHILNIQELSTCAQYRLTPKIVCLNNRFLGMVRQWQQIDYGSRYSESYMDCLLYTSRCV